MALTSESAWTIVPTAGDGDCLFHAIAGALSEALGQRLSHRHLRAVVARTILTPTPKTAATITAWMNMVAAGMGDEVPHVPSDMFRKWMRHNGKCTPADLQRLFTHMMQPHLYWGCEYAINVLEAHFKCCILVYDGEWRRQIHITPHEPLFFIPVMYEGEHYSLLQFNGRSILYAVPPVQR